MLDRITFDPNILAGRATLRGLRISAAHSVNLVANGMSSEEIRAELPDLEIEDIRQALRFAAMAAEFRIRPRPHWLLRNKIANPLFLHRTPAPQSAGLGG